MPAEPQHVVATGYAVPALIEVGAPLIGVSAWSTSTTTIDRSVPVATAQYR